MQKLTKGAFGAALALSLTLSSMGTAQALSSFGSSEASVETITPKPSPKPSKPAPAPEVKLSEQLLEAYKKVLTDAGFIYSQDAETYAQQSLDLALKGELAYEVTDGVGQANMYSQDGKAAMFVIRIPKNQVTTDRINNLSKTLGTISYQTPFGAKAAEDSSYIYLATGIKVYANQF
ncbi:hypothetical protein [Corynebacterium epidermidicanis]|uniref:Secreted protein n=1 Tax=Corynebacterium epidermidicanis TaxID=1050174 RepID=A0A0G3GS87_9CORY|nr:hypothetical protein [Corynebacterium epidermidicanis]AKK03999.1 hypothetical protein CEPID_10850 [Corynebacterium epidermidicanis]